MNWDDVRVFLALSRGGSFAAAGRQLGVNATTVSRRLGALEQAVGAQLFTRTRDGLVPTAAGEEMVGPAELIERQTQRIERSVGGGDTRLAGRVRLNVTQNLAAGFLVDQLQPFRRKHPDIELEIWTTDTMVDLARGDAEIVVRHRSPGAGPGVESTGAVEVIARRTASVGVAVYAAKSYLERAGVPRSADDVEGHDVIMPIHGDKNLPGSSWSLAVEDRVRTSLRTDGMVAMQSACAAGFGLCALPCFSALQYPTLMRVSETIDTRETWLLQPGDLRRVARVRALWEHLLGLLEHWKPLLTGEVTPADRDAREARG